MEITREVRDYASRLNEAPASGLAPERETERDVELAEETTQVDPNSDPQAGMDAMSEKFRELGNQIYIDKP
jgi:hypothetical protein